MLDTILTWTSPLAVAVAALVVGVALDTFGKAWANDGYAAPLVSFFLVIVAGLVLTSGLVLAPWSRLTVACGWAVVAYIVGAMALGWVEGTRRRGGRP